jgi:predicted RNA-binding Zn-ribbon protein involved in translation (DUF1610 family)
MKKFKCPYCNENTVSRFRKAFAGSLKSKGYKCPNCGGRCVNGRESTVFHAILSLTIFIAIIIKSYKDPNNLITFSLVLFGLYFIISRVFDAFFFELEKTWRIDVNIK